VMEYHSGESDLPFFVAAMPTWSYMRYVGHKSIAGRPAMSPAYFKVFYLESALITAG
jgi:hypothetical protein